MIRYLLLLTRKRLFLGMIGVVAALLFSDGIEGHHNWPPVLPGLCGRTILDCPTPLIQKTIDNGYVTYGFDEQTSKYPNFKVQAAQVVEAAYTRIGIAAYEVSRQPDIWLTMPPDADFIKVCGDRAAACIVYWGDPAIVYFRKALLYSDWKTSIAHEGINVGHAEGEHERYDDVYFVCLPFPVPTTVMSCGSGIWIATDFDTYWVRQATVPHSLTAYGLRYHPDGTPYVFWCDPDQVRGKRVAIMYLDYPGLPVEDDVYYWSGYHLPLAPTCTGQVVPLDTGRCFFLAAENSWNWQRSDLRNDVLAGCL